MVVGLPLPHEARVQPDRDVVQEETVTCAAHVDGTLGSLERVERGDRVVGIEPEVAGEVVPRPDRDDEEGQPALDRNGCDRPQRAVAAARAERVRIRFAGQRLHVVARLEEVRGDAAALRLLGDLRARALTRTWVDDQKASLRHGR